MKYYILKQFLPNSQIWVVQLDENDPIYEYDTLEEADLALPTVQLSYPNNLCKVSGLSETYTR